LACVDVASSQANSQRASIDEEAAFLRRPSERSPAKILRS
jgi:hypothetical protein